MSKRYGIDALFSHDNEMQRLREQTMALSTSPLQDALIAIRRHDEQLRDNVLKALIPPIDSVSGANGGAEFMSVGSLSKALAETLAGEYTPHRSVLDRIAGYGGITNDSADLYGAASGRLTDLASKLAGGAYSVGAESYGAASGRFTDLALGLAAGRVPSASMFVDQFRRPEVDEISALLGGMREPLERRYGLTTTMLQASLRTMHTPWLDTRDELGSLTGIAKLHGIANLVSAQPSFDVGVARILRSDLGDWRDRITLPGNIGVDVDIRANLYVERGFNPRLTDFPADTFDEGLETSGLLRGIPILVSTYGEPVPRSDDEEEEAAYARNNVVHDWLQRFETQIRRFVDVAMTETFGADWPRHRLPKDLYEKWLEKQTRDSRGHQWPLIHYADFTDYELVICKKDNWKAIFARRFGRAELVRESFQRLYPSRIAAMHARPLMPEDALFVFTEIKRLVLQLKT
jgi:hypothetical protein